MATRGLVGSCLLSLWATGNAAAQVVVLSPPIPVFVPEPIPVVVGPPPTVGPLPTVAPPTGAEPKAGPSQSNYPPATEAQQQRQLGPRVIHERHYLSPTMNLSNYMASKSGQNYDAGTMLVIRDYYITDEPAPKKAPPPVGSAEETKATDAQPPKNSSDAQFDGMLGDKNPSGLKVPNPAA